MIEHPAAERSVPVLGSRSDTRGTLDALFGSHQLLRLEQVQADLLLRVWDATEDLPADLADVVRDSSGTGAFDARALEDDYAGVVEAIRDANARLRHKEVLMPEDYVPEPDALLIRFAFLGEALRLSELLDAWAQAKPTGPRCEAPLISGEEPTTLELVLNEDTRSTGLRLCLGVPGRDVSLVRWHDGERWTTDISQLKQAVPNVTGIDTGYQDILILAVRTTARVYEPINSILRRFAADHQIRATSLDQDVYASVHEIWSQFHNRPRAGSLYPVAGKLAEWLDDLYPITARELVELIWTTADAVQTDPLPIDDVFVEALVGLASETVFALHLVRAIQQPGQSSWHVLEHAWRQRGEWDSDFPEAESRWAAECRRLSRNPELVEAALRDLGVDQPFELAWDAATAYRLHPGNADLLVALFDQGVTIPRGLVQLAEIDPSRHVASGGLDQEVVAAIKHAVVMCAPRDGIEARHHQLLTRWADGLEGASVESLIQAWAGLPPPPRVGLDVPVFGEPVEDYETALKHWQDVATEANKESQWADACSWILAARLVKSVDECRFWMSWYPTGIGTVLTLALTDGKRQAELRMNRGGSIRGTGFAGNPINWDSPTILSMPWVWWTCMSPEGRAQVLDEIHRGLGIQPVHGRPSSRQVLSMRLLGQILTTNMGDSHRWWSHHPNASPGGLEGSQIPTVSDHPDELVCVLRGQEPRAWVHEGILWTGGQRIDAYERYRSGASLASIAAAVQPGK